MFHPWTVLKINNLRKLLLSALFLVNIVYIIYYCLLRRFQGADDNINPMAIQKHLINNTGCTIEDADIYSPEIRAFLYKVNPISCTDKPLLTYITRVGDQVKLNINAEAIVKYSYFKVECCYVTIKRNPVGPNPDDNLIFSKCLLFKHSVIIDEEVVKVKCFNIFRTVYENIHAILRPPEEVPNKNNTNVILMGIDGVSRSNFIRTMPKTHRHLMDNGWIDMKGYNKIEDNTFPNVIAVLAGTVFSYDINYDPDICNPFDTKKLESCNFIWKMYKSANYTTALAEDTPNIGTFNSNKAGFVSAPTDYYFRPYFLALEELTAKYLCLKAHCTGPEKTGIRMQNVITDFLDVIKNRTPGFGMFWMNTFSHEDVNCPSSMDEDFEVFLKNLERKGHLDNTIIVFYSDHGFRFGKIRLTSTGWLEERLPFIYIWIPEIFRKAYVEEYNYLLENTERLTSPYDLYKTLQHIISLSSPETVQLPAQGCLQCQSMFKKIKSERTCKDAGIPEHYCTCSKYKKFNEKAAIANNLANFFITEINKRIRSHGSVSKHCAPFYLDQITHIKKLVLIPNIEENYLIGVITNPEANFEATVKVNFQNGVKMTLNQVNRLDRYAPTSYCAKGSNVQMFCYCKSILKKLTNIFCNNKYCFL